MHLCGRFYQAGRVEMESLGGGRKRETKGMWWVEVGCREILEKAAENNVSANAFWRRVDIDNLILPIQEQ